MAHILVADDMPTHLDYISKELQSLDFEASTAPNGETYLKRIAENRPNLVLLDYATP